MEDVSIMMELALYLGDFLNNFFLSLKGVTGF